jgi:hypothetical protein
MTTFLTEETRGGKLSFEFSDKWQVYKYDEQILENFYEKIKNNGLKAVDFIAVSDKVILLIEVKYITATNENSMMRFSAIPSEKETFLLKQIKEKLTIEDKKLIKTSLKRPYLATEVAKKVKDTLVGLCASYRRCDKNLQPYSQSLFVDNKAIIVILFLERKGNLNQPAQFKPLATNLKKSIEQKISFLGNISVSVINTLTIPPELKIQVSNYNT